jgi:hypothetical protein
MHEQDLRAAGAAAVEQDPGARPRHGWDGTRTPRAASRETTEWLGDVPQAVIPDLRPVCPASTGYTVDRTVCLKHSDESE